MSSASSVAAASVMTSGTGAAGASPGHGDDMMAMRAAVRWPAWSRRTGWRSRACAGSTAGSRLPRTWAPSATPSWSAGPVGLCPGHADPGQRGRGPRGQEVLPQDGQDGPGQVQAHDPVGQDRHLLGHARGEHARRARRAALPPTSSASSRRSHNNVPSSIKNIV